MKNCTRYLGLDVHAQTITAAIAEGRGRIRSLGKFPNRPEAVRRLIERLDGQRNLKVCYEAGPTGYALYWQLTKLGVDCEVIAPSLAPKKVGDKVKTDRRDAERLAQSYQAGDLTPVWVPTPEHEALRDLVRVDGDAAGAVPAIRPASTGVCRSSVPMRHDRPSARPSRRGSKPPRSIGA